jgi:hypothetical protein
LVAHLLSWDNNFRHSKFATKRVLLKGVDELGFEVHRDSVLCLEAIEEEEEEEEEEGEERTWSETWRWT